MIDFVQQQLPVGLFYLFCVLSILFAAGVVIFKGPVSCAFSLIAVLLNVAGIFAMQEAFFVSAVQVLVYAGAIMVLFVFVIMLLSMESIESDLDSSGASWFLALGSGFVFFLLMAFVFVKGTLNPQLGAFSLEGIRESGGNIRVVSEAMFSQYMLPFQLVGMLLSTAVVGAVVLAKRKVE